MDKTINISWEGGSLKAALNDSPTARQIWAGLPIEGAANRWGDEIYFAIPVEAALEEDAREIIEAGTLAYWPTGSAFCIFFGRTPASTDDRPRAYSPVNVLGSVSGETSALRVISSGTLIRLTRAADDA
jgi:hypothetical protein